ncbi:MAG TPA: entericidin A/B family lipoprotein [Verrucomicrobiales bacterium]|nr:entericidin A/B family lipoprotein [Verrucomicrobiales bacterium]
MESGRQPEISIVLCAEKFKKETEKYVIETPLMKNRNEQGKRIRRAVIGMMIAVAACGIPLNSCNTMEGVGEDVQGAGRAIESTARDASY